MKVGYVLKKFPRLSETFILNEILALERAGVEVEVLSLKEPDDEPRHAALAELKAPCAVIQQTAPRSIFRHLETVSQNQDGETSSDLKHYCRRLDSDDPLRAKALANTVALAPAVLERRIDHIHAHFGTIATATAAETSLLTGVPYSFTVHAKDIYRDTVDFDRLSRWIADAAFAVTVCKANAEWLESRCASIALDRLRVLYNGVELDHWKVEGHTERRAVFVAVGRLVEKKGFDDFLRACSLVRDSGKTFQAHLIGAGEADTELRELRASLDLGDIVRMPGAMPQEQVRELIQKARLLVAPCRVGEDGNRDALPTVLLEALAAGTPCLTTAVSGIPEIVDNGKHGFIVDSNAPRELARVMTQAIECPEPFAEMGRVARQRAANRFDLHENVSRLRDWFADSAGTEARVDVEGAGD